MKKLIFLIALGCCTALFLQSCIKNCTCVNPDTDKVTEFDIDPSESCSDYSNKERGICS